MAASKNQTTREKIQREQAVKARRMRKQEKRSAKREAAAAVAAGIETPAAVAPDEWIR